MFLEYKTLTDYDCIIYFIFQKLRSNDTELNFPKLTTYFERVKLTNISKIFDSNIRECKFGISFCETASTKLQTRCKLISNMSHKRFGSNTTLRALNAYQLTYNPSAISNIEFVPATRLCFEFCLFSF